MTHPNIISILFSVIWDIIPKLKGSRTELKEGII